MDDLPVEARRKRFNEAISRAEKRLAELDQLTTAAARGSRGQLQEMALPQFDAKRESFLRQDTAMLLGSLPPGEVGPAMEKLVKEDRALRGFLSRGHGRNFLVSRGVPAADAAHQGVVAAAIRAAADDSDTHPTHRGAAQHWLRGSAPLEKPGIALRHAAFTQLERLKSMSGKDEAARALELAYRQTEARRIGAQAARRRES
jgi:hypothetical protein